MKSLLEQNHISPSRRWCHKRLASNKVPAFSSEGWGHKGEKRRARKILFSFRQGQDEEKIWTENIKQKRIVSKKDFMKFELLIGRMD